MNKANKANDNNQLQSEHWNGDVGDWRADGKQKPLMILS